METDASLIGAGLAIGPSGEEEMKGIGQRKEHDKVAAVGWFDKASIRT